MATKVKEEELFELSEPTKAPEFVEPMVHTMLRAIATTAIPIGDTQMISQVDADVSAWVERGYRLVNTHYVGREPEGIMMLYVLSK